MDHMEGTVPVFESKIAANARVHARTHATPYRIPSICSLRCPSATCVQTSAQCVPYRNHEHEQSVDSKIVPVSSIAPEGWGPKESGNATSPLHSRGSPKEGEQNQKSKPRPRVTMMHHATKRGFKDCPGFLNSTGRLGPKSGRKCYVTPAFSGVPKRRGTKSEVKTYARGHHDAPRGP